MDSLRAQHLALSYCLLELLLQSPILFLFWNEMLWQQWSGSGKKHKYGYFLIVLQLIHGPKLADISCTTTAKMTKLVLFPLLSNDPKTGQLFLRIVYQPSSRQTFLRRNPRLDVTVGRRAGGRAGGRAISQVKRGRNDGRAAHTIELMDCSLP